jgi:hypothetical protein
MTFHRNNNIEAADLGEKIGNCGLGLLRIGFGKTVDVNRLDGKTDFQEKAHSTTERVAAIALFIFTLPISGTIAVIGCIAYAFSKSHEKIFNSYEMFSIGKSAPKMRNSAKIDYLEVEVPLAQIMVSVPKMGNSASIDHIERPYAPIMDFGYLIPEVDKTIVQKVKVAEEGPNLGPQMRRIPPLSLIDTLIVVDGEFTSEHGTVDFFTDDEILENLNIIKTVIKENTEIRYTKNGKAILQQQATRGCTAATAAMLMLDNGKEPNYWGLRTRTLANDEEQVANIKSTGLKAFINKAKDLSELKDMILRHDSCVGSFRGGHVIVIDEVSSDLSKIRMRDPYHGWEITVGSESFLNKWIPGNIIQIEK